MIFIKAADKGKVWDHHSRPKDIFVDALVDNNFVVVFPQATSYMEPEKLKDEEVLCFGLVVVTTISRSLIWKF